MDWRYGSSGTASALQVRSFKPQPHQRGWGESRKKPITKEGQTLHRYFSTLVTLNVLRTKGKYGKDVSLKG
jgi:hypothetical protein